MGMKRIEVWNIYVRESSLDLKRLRIVRRRKNQFNSVPNRVPDIEFDVAHGPEDNVDEVETDEGPEENVETEIHEEARTDGR